MRYSTQQDVLDFVEDNNVKFVRFAFCDIFGTQKNIAVLASDLPDADAFSKRLPEYFPRPLREAYGDAISAHPLRREITTTLLVNEMVDGGGISYAYRLAEEISA